MPANIKVAACQVPIADADIETTLHWIMTFATKAATVDACLVCFPECFLQGYLCDEDHARRHAMNLTSPAFEAVLQRLAGLTPTLVFGMIESDGKHLFNTAVVVSKGQLIGRYRKTHLLPGEKIFVAGTEYPVFQVNGLTFGINICFDTNFADAAAALASRDAKLILCPANNMMSRAKAIAYKDLHNTTRSQRAKETRTWLISSDVTGETDDRLAIGPTAVINPQGQIVMQVPSLEVGMVVAEIL